MKTMMMTAAVALALTLTAGTAFADGHNGYGDRPSPSASFGASWSTDRLFGAFSEGDSNDWRIDTRVDRRTLDDVSVEFDTCDGACPDGGQRLVGSVADFTFREMIAEDHSRGGTEFFDTSRTETHFDVEVYDDGEDIGWGF
jgi:hypothetical protein